MAAVQDHDHTRFAGLRNSVPAERFKLPDLVTAMNVDIDDSRRISRRAGYGSPFAAGAYKSLWSSGDVALAVRNQTELVRIMPDYTVSVLRTGLTPGVYMSYTRPADVVYYSNSRETGVIDGGTSRSWGLEVMPEQPVATAVAGNLPPGTYQYAVTFLRNDGQESGTPEAGVIELVAQGGIALSNIPVSDDMGVTRKVVYFSTRDGDTLYRVGVLFSSDTSYLYLSELPSNSEIRTQFLSPPPAGQVVSSFNGRTLVASGGTLYYSEAYAPELYDLRKNYRFGGLITMIAPLEDGVFVGTKEEIVWLSGQKPENWSLKSVADYGVPLHAYGVGLREMFLTDEQEPTGSPTKEVALFGTTRGLCLGEDGGTMTNLTQKRFAYPIQDRGAVLIRRHRGMVQAVVSFQGAEVAASVAP